MDEIRSAKPKLFSLINAFCRSFFFTSVLVLIVFGIGILGNFKASVKMPYFSTGEPLPRIFRTIPFNLPAFQKNALSKEQLLCLCWILPFSFHFSFFFYCYSVLEKHKNLLVWNYQTNLEKQKPCKYYCKIVNCRFRTTYCSSLLHLFNMHVSIHFILNMHLSFFNFSCRFRFFVVVVA